MEVKGCVHDHLFPTSRDLRGVGPLILSNRNTVTIMDVVRISSEDRQYKKPDNQERNEKTALQQELVKEIPDNELSKNPYEEGDERPWPQLCQETQYLAVEMGWLPGQRRVDPGSDQTGDDSSHRGEQTSTNQEQGDRQQNQDQAAILSVNKGRRPDHCDEADNKRQDARYQIAGNDRHGGFAKIPHLFRVARRAHGGYHEAVRPDIPSKYFKVTVFWTPKSGKNTEQRGNYSGRFSHFCPLCITLRRLDYPWSLDQGGTSHLSRPKTPRLADAPGSFL
jgi:hypothetical protein